MDDNLQEQFITCIKRIKKMHPVFPQDHMHHGAHMLLIGIAARQFEGHAPPSVSELQHNLGISKPAVSQTLNTLEKHGLVIREIDPNDRRRVIVKLTDAGFNSAEQARGHMDRMLGYVLGELGEEDTREFIRILSRLGDISEKMKTQIECKGGENDC